MNKAKKMTLGKLIALAMEMEMQAYEFYGALEKRFCGNEQFCTCLSGVKEDELLHLRVLKEIKASLSEVRLLSPVTEESIESMEQALEFIKHLDVGNLTSTEEVCDAIGRLEAVEFDVVMNFVNADEIDFEFTREYLKNESIDHASRIYLAQQCLE
ncbi:hypothetical protein OAN24_04885 [Pseudodesulfovibrio sp.]|nr:hypothetical protein [Pseudodesulfovibrio sp.]